MTAISLMVDVYRLVSKLQLGNPVLEAPASCLAKLELRLLSSQAGAWELATWLIGVDRVGIGHQILFTKVRVFVLIGLCSYIIRLF